MLRDSRIAISLAIDPRHHISTMASNILESERTTNADGFIASSSIDMGRGEEPVNVVVSNCGSVGDSSWAPVVKRCRSHWSFPHDLTIGFSHVSDPNRGNWNVKEHKQLLDSTAFLVWLGSEAGTPAFLKKKCMEVAAKWNERNSPAKMANSRLHVGKEFVSISQLFSIFFTNTVRNLS